MTFIVALLREQGVGTLQVAAFYALLGLWPRWSRPGCGRRCWRAFAMAGRWPC